MIAPLDLDSLAEAHRRRENRRTIGLAVVILVLVFVAFECGGLHDYQTIVGLS